MAYPNNIELISLEANEDPADPDGTGTVIDADHWNLVGRLINTIEARVGTTADAVGLETSHEGRLKLIESLGGKWTNSTTPATGGATGDDVTIFLPPDGFFITPPVGGIGSDTARVVNFHSDIFPRFFAMSISGWRLRTSSTFHFPLNMMTEDDGTWKPTDSTIGLFWYDGTQTLLLGPYAPPSTGTGGGGGTTAANTIIVQHEGTAVGTQGTVNFRGLGVSVSEDTIANRINVDVASGGGGGGSAHIIEDNGTGLAARSKLNFSGFGVKATDVVADDATLITVPGLIVQDEGTGVTQRGKVNFVGAGVTVTDDLTNVATIVTIPGPAVQVNGSDLPNQPKLNFTGAVSVTNGSGVTNIAITGGGGTALSFLDEGGSPLTQRAVINFVGPGIAATDDMTNGRTVITVPQFGTSAAGVVPASGGGTTNFLRADGMWAAPAGGSVGVTVEDEGGAGTLVTTLNFVGPGISVGVSGSLATINVPFFTGTNAGVVNSSPNNSTDFLRADGLWAVPPGTGGGGSGNATSIQSVAVSATAPTTGQVLEYNGTLYVPTTPSAGGGGASGAIFDAPPTIAGGTWSMLNLSGPTGVPGTLSVTDVASGILLDWPNTTTPGNHVRGIERPIVGGATFDYITRIDGIVNDASPIFYGMFIRQVAAGGNQNKIITFGPVVGSGVQAFKYQVDIWTDMDTYGANVKSEALYPTSPPWLRIRSNGTTIFFEVSSDDGQTWVTWSSFGYTAQLTPDRVGVAVSSIGANGLIHAVLRSWGTAIPTLA